jgi:hypothetical protein
MILIKLRSIVSLRKPPAVPQKGRSSEVVKRECARRPPPCRTDDRERKARPATVGASRQEQIGGYEIEIRLLEGKIYDS